MKKMGIALVIMAFVAGAVVAAQGYAADTQGEGGAKTIFQDLSDSINKKCERAPETQAKEGSNSAFQVMSDLINKKYDRVEVKPLKKITMFQSAADEFTGTSSEK